jgi:hypothetical protein
MRAVVARRSASMPLMVRSAPQAGVSNHEGIVGLAVSSRRIGRRPVATRNDGIPVPPISDSLRID